MSVFNSLSALERSRIDALTLDLRSTEAGNKQVKSTSSIASHTLKALLILSLAVIAFLLFGLGNILLILCSAVIAFGVVIVIRRSKKQWTVVEEFERDYPAFLLSIASAVKTGLDPLDAITMSYEMFPPQSPVQAEAKKVVDAINAGEREETAIRLFGGAIPHPDIRLFHDSFLIARQCGASIAPALSRLALFTRQRQLFRRKARAAVAMQRLSSYGIMGCCLVIGVAQCIANPRSLSAVIDHSVGKYIFGAGFALMFAGMAWMGYVTRKRM